MSSLNLLTNEMQNSEPFIISMNFQSYIVAVVLVTFYVFNPNSSSLEVSGS